MKREEKYVYQVHNVKTVAMLSLSLKYSIHIFEAKVYIIDLMNE